MSQDIKEVVREKYGQIASQVSTGGGGACCGSAPSAGRECDPITSNLYNQTETADIPIDAVTASLGCGNPTALAQLKPGSRIVSHDYDMRGAKPVQVLRMNLDMTRTREDKEEYFGDGSHVIYKWVVPWEEETTAIQKAAAEPGHTTRPSAVIALGAKLEKLAELLDWVEPYRKIWTERFDNLESYLDEPDSPRKRPGKRK